MMKRLKHLLGIAIASLALLVSVTSANQVCAFLIGQPELPESVKALRRF